MTDDMPGDHRSPMVIRSPKDVLSAVPYLLGFHPDNSLVAVGSGGPNGTCAMRIDLPLAAHPAADGDATQDIGERLAAMLAHNRFPIAVMVGYGPAARVTPLMDAAGSALARHHIRLREALRVEGDRYWSYLCDDLECCPAEGTRFDITTSTVAAQATLEGQVVLADRAELARTVAPLAGTARTSMRQATGRAEERILAWADGTLDDSVVRSRMIAEGLPLVRRVTGRIGSEDTPPTDDEAAWLGLLLTHLRVRDEAWVRVDLDRLGDHIEFWRDVLRRVEEPYAAAPACLLAYAAFSAGDGGLANVALERAFTADPGYSMAHLLHDLVGSGIPPSAARLRMTPAELAAAYEDDVPGRRDGRGDPETERRAS
ncbi:MAG: hypothetical protein JWO67_1005 [Streptosporangiaceae bacterium]|jgi:hypothetical protein|nr:hypothetical protein [Streptosporangiaceae bacterium]